MADLLAHVVALLLYPGLALALAVGLVAEASARLLEGRGVREAFLGPLAELRDAPVLVAGAALLSSLADVQLTAPLNPLPVTERNVLVAVIALAAVTWLVWARAWEAHGARLTLAAQAGWLLAVLAPAAVSQTLRPTALGAVLVPSLLPLKLAAAILYLACLPLLLRAAVTRTFVWMALGGLFVSLFVPPLSEDLGGVLLFLAGTAVVLALAVALGRLARRLPLLASR